MARSRSFVVAIAVGALCWTTGVLSNAPPVSLLSRVVSAQATKPAPQTMTVYVTKTGEKYHLGSCNSLRKSRIETTIADAKRRGLTACKLCKPPA